MKKLTLLKTSWKTINWKKFQIRVFKWQRQIYKASKDGDTKKVRRLQHILLNSTEAKFLAVRRVTQDNKGKKTAGIDKVKSLTPIQRVTMAKSLSFPTAGSPLRRVWIPKPGTTEKRPLGIPVMRDRCLQALMKLAMEPEWEAKFEPNSYGFRPGRNCHDAVTAIQNCIQKRAKYVLDADIAKCFDKIDHKALLDKIGFKGKYRKQIKSWLKSGIWDDESFSETTLGTPQGGVISPLLANIALHGLESVVKDCIKGMKVTWASGTKVRPSRISETVQLIRYADDFVILHDNLEVILKCKEAVENFLKEIGLELSATKTRLTHTLELTEEAKPELGFDGKVGFDFLGFTFKQFKTKHKSSLNTRGNKLGFKTLIYPSKKSIKKHQKALHDLILVKGKGLSQKALIKKINAIVRGWAQYFGISNANTTGHLGKQDYLLYLKLRKWSLRIKGTAGKAAAYWKNIGNNKWTFATPDKKTILLKHIDYSQGLGKVDGYVKVRMDSSPFDENQMYWALRLTKNPLYSKRVITLLKRQKGCCSLCKLKFLDDDVWEVDHITPRKDGGKDSYDNFQLLHVHCHDLKTKLDNQRGIES